MINLDPTSASPARAEALDSRDLAPPEPFTPSSWITSGRFAALLGLLILAAFADVAFLGQTFFYRDFSCFGYPLAWFHRACFWNGEWPLWNPLNNCGIPFLAQWNTLTLYPFSGIYLLLPMPWGLNIFVLAHLFLAGWGMFCLARDWTRCALAAALAGLVFTFNGLTLHSLMWPNNIAALGWMPLVILWAGRARTAGGRSVVAAAILGGLQMLTGAPEIILFTWLVIAGEAVLHPGRREWIGWLRLGGIAGLVVLLAAAQLIPFVDLVAHGHRDQNYGGDSYPMPSWGPAAFLIPLLHCKASMNGVFEQAGQSWTSSYYVGIVTLLLAIHSLREWRRPRVRMLFLVALAGIVLALGAQGGILPWLRRLCPLVGFIRFPIKFVVLTVFALPLLAAFAVARWNNLPQAARRVDVGRAWLAGALIVITGSLVLWMEKSHLAPSEIWAITEKSAMTRLAILAAGLLLLSCLGPGWRWWTRVALLGLVAWDGLSHVPRQNPSVAMEALRPGLSELRDVAASGGYRAMTSPRVQAFLDYASHSNALIFCLGERRAFVPNFNLLDGVATPGGFYSLFIPEQREIWSMFYAATNFPESLADFVGVAAITSDETVFGRVPRSGAEPLVRAGANPVFLDRAETRRSLLTTNFGRGRTVYLPPEASSIIRATRQSAAKILSTERSSRRVIVEIETPGPSVVTVAQTYYHWWRATVNGQRVPLWRANLAFQALEVPAGRSRVELEYIDWGFRAGVLLSLATLLTLGIYGWRRRRSSARQSISIP